MYPSSTEPFIHSIKPPTWALFCFTLLTRWPIYSKYLDPLRQRFVQKPPSSSQHRASCWRCCNPPPHERSGTKIRGHSAARLRPCDCRQDVDLLAVLCQRGNADNLNITLLLIVLLLLLQPAASNDFARPWCLSNTISSCQRLFGKCWKPCKASGVGRDSTPEALQAPAFLRWTGLRLQRRWGCAAPSLKLPKGSDSPWWPALEFSQEVVYGLSRHLDVLQFQHSFNLAETEASFSQLHHFALCSVVQSAHIGLLKLPMEKHW